MINAIDVRVGNKVMWGVHLCTIEGIHTRNITEKENKTEHFYISGAVDFSQYYCVYPYDIAPVILTPEILDKCGFEDTEVPENFSNGFGAKRIFIGPAKCRYLLISAVSSIPFIYDSYGNIGDIFKGSPCGRHITSLHQLQNLYYSLTGKELEFKK